MFFISKYKKIVFSLYSQKKIFENRKQKLLPKHNLMIGAHFSCLVCGTCGFNEIERLLNSKLLIQIPFTLWIVQSLLESIDYDFIDSLGLSVPLWIDRSQVPILDMQFTTVPYENFVIKLKPIVWDEGMRDPKPSDNIFP